MEQAQSEIYDIYHDESQEESYWHGFLFVPRISRQYLLDLLMKARGNINWQYPISFKEIGRRQGTGSPKTRLVSSWLTIGLAALQQQKFHNLPVAFSLGGSPPECKLRIERPIRCKFVIFKEKDKHEKMFYGLSALACIETTFRMGIKGGVHRLFSDNEPIIIGNIFIDGDRHYIKRFGRRLDVNRSLRRFAKEKRPYVSFIRGAKLIPQRSNHNKIKLWQNPDDIKLLQLCDFLLGGVRFHSYCPDSRKIKYKISWPCKKLLEHDQDSPARMKESRFYNGFLLDEAWLEDDRWQFGQLNIGKDEADEVLTTQKLRL
jgi:hypothetical protein